MKEHFRTTYQWLCKVASGEVESWHGSLEKWKNGKIKNEIPGGSEWKLQSWVWTPHLRPKMDKSTASPTAPMRPKNDKACARVEFRVFFEKKYGLCMFFADLKQDIQEMNS